MAEAEWVTAEQLHRLFVDNFDADGFVKPDSVPVLAKGTLIFLTQDFPKRHAVQT